MNTVYDVQQLLKKFGIFVYVGERIADLELMEAEIKDLYFANLIPKEQFQQALLILRNEITKEQKK
ncbi:YqgQ family protein [Lederbergia lenta]|uniref:Cytoplasmic protein n=1 Tax=Lederbergia lenta TaxID=1467 RepID=A0A2X4WEK6_LEDLE|nr:YqgQ family protein [Lederbergia lenta]MCM3111429.1 YqgQ family protein [Lederbergia lenta]MEC2325185.1 YqgQ family protein [Lederbergia lenta]SQI56060.1 cytoplasmic protein [Lederbergia lenta]